jgi:hypothetical protein
MRLAVALAEAGDDEQRVVDADPEPEQRRELRREVRRVEQVRAESDQADSIASRIARLASASAAARGKSARRAVILASLGLRGTCRRIARIPP